MFDVRCLSFAVEFLSWCGSPVVRPFMVNPNYNVAPRAAVASRRILPFESKTAGGNLRRQPSVAAPRQRVSSPSLAVLLAFFGALRSSVLP
jgi:hypothetical protein